MLIDPSLGLLHSCVPTSSELLRSCSRSKAIGRHFRSPQKTHFVFCTSLPTRCTEHSSPAIPRLLRPPRTPQTVHTRPPKHRQTCLFALGIILTDCPSSRPTAPTTTARINFLKS